MSGWRQLGIAEWRAHPLNRIGGWLLLVALLLFLEGPLVGAVTLAEAISDFDALRAAVRMVRPEWYGWLQLVVPLAAPVVLLILLLLRARWFPEVYLGLRLATYALAALSGAFAAWDEWWLALGQASMITGEIALAVYLFVGRRPNIVFRRRDRTAA